MVNRTQVALPPPRCTLKPAAAPWVAIVVRVAHVTVTTIDTLEKQTVTWLTVSILGTSFVPASFVSATERNFSQVASVTVAIVISVAQITVTSIDALVKQTVTWLTIAILDASFMPAKFVPASGRKFPEVTSVTIAIVVSVAQWANFSFNALENQTIVFHTVGISNTCFAATSFVVAQSDDTDITILLAMIVMETEMIMLTIISDAWGVDDGIPEVFGAVQNVLFDLVKVMMIQTIVFNTVSILPIFSVKSKNKLEFGAAKDGFVVLCCTREGFTQSNKNSANDVACTLVSVVNNNMKIVDSDVQRWSCGQLLLV
jgi:hypothetical protein